MLVAARLHRKDVDTSARDAGMRGSAIWRECRDEGVRGADKRDGAAVDVEDWHRQRLLRHFALGGRRLVLTSSVFPRPEPPVSHAVVERLPRAGRQWPPTFPMAATAPTGQRRWRRQGRRPACTFREHAAAARAGLGTRRGRRGARGRGCGMVVTVFSFLPVDAAGVCRHWNRRRAVSRASGAKAR